ncbi:flagellar basal body P-ring formation chaperone FlgA [Glaciimonas soli]|uniref:Flagella basal body P-ring formation protein FlgA n=1 Tax=Glaciimonas soli TaxID=2590999 RepID=A0A843YNA7_9BURK|nr:flagellar basal body P-ring formation chaperone FlgA [Glaciimonas soli]MQQ99466.1 flagellar basal body P-ring formation protein FlgA [Glaciimonas soli]
MHQRPPHKNTAHRKCLKRFGVTVFIGVTTMFGAHAQSSVPSGADPLIKQFLLEQASGLPGKIDITVNAASANLPACASEISAFLPSGASVWGRVSIGIRCQKSAAQAEWTRYVAAHVAVFSNYLTTNRTIAAGAPLSAADVSIKEGDLTALPRNIITDMRQITGLVTRNRLPQGAPIRQESVKNLEVIKQGQTVKVSAQGQGFVASTEGRAMSNGSVGARLQVKADNGKMLQGIVLADGTVEMPS